MTSKHKIFADVAHQLKQLDHQVLKELAQHMEAGEHVIPESDAEKLCFNVVTDAQDQAVIPMISTLCSEHSDPLSSLYNADSYSSRTHFNFVYLLRFNS